MANERCVSERFGVTHPDAKIPPVTRSRIVLSYPDMHGRYFLFPIYSAWTEVLSAPGKRTLGTGSQSIAITGPKWQGTLPQGITRQVKSPTDTVFIIARVYAQATAEDYAAVNALQRDFKLVPLSAYGKPYTPPAGTVDPKAPSVKEIVRNLISAMDGQTYFGMLAKSMAVNPPVLPQDAPITAEMAKIGLVPGQPFDLGKLAPDAQKALADVGKIASDQIAGEFKKGGKTLNGWLVAKCGTYGTNYLWRAAISAYGWGCNLPQDAVYPTAKDADGAQSLDQGDLMITTTRREFTKVALLGTPLLFMGENPLWAQAATVSPAVAETLAIAKDAYIYGYSLMTTEVPCADE
jgi:hypothetical protein